MMAETLLKFQPTQLLLMQQAHSLAQLLRQVEMLRDHAHFKLRLTVTEQQHY